MATKKQILLPIGILGIGIAAMGAFISMKKPPEEKEKVDNTPIVSIQPIDMHSMTLDVSSYGEVKPKYQTDLVAQVTGQVIELSDDFVRGGFVKQGQLLARIDPSDYQAALIEAQANLASANAELEKERAQGKVAESEWKRIKNSMPTELSLRKPQLAQELARVKAAEAAVLRAKRNLERTEITAPYDAMIASREIGLGSVVSMGSRLGQVQGTNIAEVRLPVADNQLQFLASYGTNAQVTLKGDFAGQPQQWQATIVRSEGVVDNQSRMNYLVAQIIDPYARSTNQTPIRFGSYVTASIEGKTIAAATLIPRYLVTEGKVALLDSDSTLHFSKVDIVREQGSNVVVAKGVSQGDRLIISALDYPVDGMKLALLDDTAEPEQPTEPKKADTQIASVKE